LTPDRTSSVAGHAIERYRHDIGQVICTCGWHGSSARGIVGAWRAHLPSTRRSRR
jgi:hypothetical protein